THNRSEYFHNEDSDEQGRVGRVCNCCSRSGHTDCNAAKQVAQSNGETSPEESESFV
ncbi:hypothetical protein FRC17_002262, partial [Serendipita sp. 399]